LNCSLFLNTHFLVAEETRRKEVEVKWQQMEKTVKPIVGIIESEEVAKKLQEAR